MVIDVDAVKPGRVLGGDRKEQQQQLAVCAASLSRPESGLSSAPQVAAATARGNKMLNRGCERTSSVGTWDSCFPAQAAAWYGQRKNGALTAGRASGTC